MKYILLLMIIVGCVGQKPRYKPGQCYAHAMNNWTIKIKKILKFGIVATYGTDERAYIPFIKMRFNFIQVDCEKDIK